MSETILIPDNWDKKLGNIIKVIGVGGGGCNAVRNMYEKGIKDVDFIICNTDAQVLGKSPVPNKIQIGKILTDGLGAGCNPEIGRQAALENIDEIKEVLSQNTKMIFIATGLGGGTGTGAAPIIAKEAKDMGILTVAIATLPFKDEGAAPYERALKGLDELKNNVDSLLIISSQKLYEIHPKLSVFEAFPKADDIVTTAAKSIAELITTEGYINVDFADVKMVMTNSGMALMGLGKASGENRVEAAAQQAMNSPLLNNNDISGAKNILVNVSSGDKNPLQMAELGQLMDYINVASGGKANFKRGVSKDLSLDADSSDSEIAVTIIATGFYDYDEIDPEQKKKPGQEPIPEQNPVQEPEQDQDQDPDTKQKGGKIIPLNNTNVETKQKSKSNKIDSHSEESEITVITVDSPVTGQSSPVNMPNITNTWNENDIAMMEKIPAYKRANAKIVIETTVAEEVSKHRLDDSEGVHTLNKND